MDNSVPSLLLSYLSFLQDYLKARLITNLLVLQSLVGQCNITITKLLQFLK